MAPRWPSSSSSSSLRVAATIAYDGTDFAGFQRQAADRTVQGEVEAGLSRLYGAAVTLRGAGRTDAGVHARGQVIAADVPATVPASRWPEALNPCLPPDVRVRESWRADDEFDPRRHATSRIYRYTLALDRRPDPLRDRFATRVDPGLDIAAMAAATARMVGTWDLVSLCCASDQNGTTTRTLRRLEWFGQPGLLTLEIEGDSFLYKQVRCMMGVLLAIGEGRYGVELVDRLLAGEPRPVPIAVAPPTGLVLERVLYGPRAGAEAGR